MFYTGGCKYLEYYCITVLGHGRRIFKNYLSEVQFYIIYGPPYKSKSNNENSSEMLKTGMPVKSN